MAEPYAIGSDHVPGLSKLVEEAGEVLQLLGKVVGCGGWEHWDEDGDLKGRLIEELGDLQAAILFFQCMNLTVVEQSEVGLRIATKLTTFFEWHKARGG